MPWGMKLLDAIWTYHPNQSLIGWQAVKMASWGLSYGVLPGYAIGHIMARDCVNNNSPYMPNDLHWKITWIWVMLMCMHLYVTLKCQSPFKGFSKQLKRPEQSQFNSSGWFDTNEMYKIIPSHSSLWCELQLVHSLEAFIIVLHSSWQFLKVLSFLCWKLWNIIHVVITRSC